MQLTINLPNREEQLALNRQRWAEVLEDRTLAVNPNRIETNAFGQVVMTSPAGGPHSGRQESIQNHLRELLGGRAIPECPISTTDGVRAADVGWYSLDRYDVVRGQLAFERSPEICVEILSPRNTDAEMRHKRSLYFDSGAIECWICDLGGRMTYYLDGDAETAHQHSRLCPDFPDQISD